jgi:hypothetical protein
VRLVVPELHPMEASVLQSLLLAYTQITHMLQPLITKKDINQNTSRALTA